MNTKIEKLPKYTIKLTVTLEKEKVKESYEKILEEAVKNTEIEGFRKGTAPKEMVKDKIGASSLYGESINDLLQTYYPQALKENLLMPVSNPRVEIKEFDLEKDFEFSATFATKPEVKIKNYKKALKDYYKEKTAKVEKEKAEKLKKGEKIEESHVHIGANEIIDILLKESEVEVADMLVEEETDRVMSRLMDQLKTINLSVENYLKAQNKTAESLRKEYDEMSIRNIKAEFVLSHLLKEENIEVTDKEIDDMIGAVGDKSIGESFNDPMQKLYVKTILQKNKLISKLIEETEGENHHEHK